MFAASPDGRRRASATGFRLAILATLIQAPPVRAGTPPAGFVETQVVSSSAVTGASVPTAIAYEPGDGDLWVLEKGDGSSEGNARVRVRDGVSGSVSTAFTLDCVDSRGERGLLGVAFAPDFTSSRHVFLFYVRRIAAAGTCSLAGQSAASRFRVSRFTESGDTLSGEAVILEGPDLNPPGNHNAGTLRFAPDGTLFISTGDNNSDADPNPLSRDLGDLRGKILRINSDGTIPADNPFVGQPGVRPEIWAWGLRNPFRFSIDPDTEAPIIGDVGERTWEAIYLGVPGADYGYPCFEGSAPFLTCDPDPPAGSVTSPIFEYGHEEQTPPVSGNSITGGPVYDHTAFPAEYHGSYFFGDYVDDWIQRGRISPSGQLVDVEMFMPDATGIADMAVSPVGCLTWVGITGAGVREVCHVGGANSQPEAKASVTPSSGLASLAVEFTGSQSIDPDADPLLYSWDLGDGSTSNLADPSHTYTNNGVYQATLTVDDQQGEANSTDSAPPLRIVVGNRSPSTTIASPVDGALYDGGDLISFSGSASDPEDGVLDADRFSWTVVFHHDTHTHPFLGPIAGIASGQFTIPAVGEDSTDVFYRLHLEARDSGTPLGPSAELSSSTFVDLLPRISELRLEANPPGFGLALEADQAAMTAPFGVDTVSGFERTVGAPSPQTIGSRTFFFQSWSDGGAAEHTVTVPANDMTVTATFAIACASPDDLLLDNHMVVGVETHDACASITAGPAYTVEAGGDLLLTAGEILRFDNGFSVVTGGKLAGAIVPRL